MSKNFSNIDSTYITCQVQKQYRYFSIQDKRGETNLTKSARILHRDCVNSIENIQNFSSLLNEIQYQAEKLWITRFRVEKLRNYSIELEKACWQRRVKKEINVQSCIVCKNNVICTFPYIEMQLIESKIHKLERVFTALRKACERSAAETKLRIYECLIDMKSYIEWISESNSLLRAELDKQLGKETHQMEENELESENEKVVLQHLICLFIAEKSINYISLQYKRDYAVSGKIDHDSLYIFLQKNIRSIAKLFLSALSSTFQSQQPNNQFNQNNNANNNNNLKDQTKLSFFFSLLYQPFCNQWVLNYLPSPIWIPNNTKPNQNEQQKEQINENEKKSDTQIEQQSVNISEDIDYSISALSLFVQRLIDVDKNERMRQIHQIMKKKEQQLENDDEDDNISGDENIDELKDNIELNSHIKLNENDINIQHISSIQFISDEIPYKAKPVYVNEIPNSQSYKDSSYYKLDNKANIMNEIQQAQQHEQQQEQQNIDKVIQQEINYSEEEEEDEYKQFLPTEQDMLSIWNKIGIEQFVNVFLFQYDYRSEEQTIKENKQNENQSKDEQQTQSNPISINTNSSTLDHSINPYYFFSNQLSFTPLTFMNQLYNNESEYVNININEEEEDKIEQKQIEGLNQDENKQKKRKELINLRIKQSNNLQLNILQDSSIQPQPINIQYEVFGNMNMNEDKDGFLQRSLQQQQTQQLNQQQTSSQLSDYQLSIISSSTSLPLSFIICIHISSALSTYIRVQYNTLYKRMMNVNRWMRNMKINRYIEKEQLQRDLLKDNKDMNQQQIIDQEEKEKELRDIRYQMMYDAIMIHTVQNIMNNNDNEIIQEFFFFSSNSNIQQQDQIRQQIKQPIHISPQPSIIPPSPPNEYQSLIHYNSQQLTHPIFSFDLLSPESSFTLIGVVASNINRYKQWEYKDELFRDRLSQEYVNENMNEIQITFVSSFLVEWFVNKMKNQQNKKEIDLNMIEYQREYQDNEHINIKWNSRDIVWEDENEQFGINQEQSERNDGNNEKQSEQDLIAAYKQNQDQYQHIMNEIQRENNKHNLTVNKFKILVSLALSQIRRQQQKEENEEEQNNKLNISSIALFVLTLLIRLHAESFVFKQDQNQQQKDGEQIMNKSKKNKILRWEVNEYIEEVKGIQNEQNQIMKRNKLQTIGKSRIQQNQSYSSPSQSSVSPTISPISSPSPQFNYLSLLKPQFLIHQGIGFVQNVFNQTVSIAQNYGL